MTCGGRIAMMKPRWWLLCGLTFLSTRAQAAAVFSPTPVDAKTYAESFSAMALLGDGTYVHATLMVSNIGMRAGRGMCKVQIMKNGRHTAHEAMVDAKDWHHAKATADTAAALHMGPCTATASAHQVIFDMSLPDAHVKLTFNQGAHPVQPPGHPVEANQRFYESEILVPFSSVELSLGDGKAPPVLSQGSGYVDHSRSTTLPADLGYGWLRFRGFAPGCAKLLLIRYVRPAQGAHSPVLAAYTWREGSAAPVEVAAAQASLPAVDTAPEHLRVSLFSGKQHLATLTAQSALLREAPLEGYGLMGRVLGSIIGSVVTETFAATLEDPKGVGACKQLRGILEVDHVSK